MAQGIAGRPAGGGGGARRPCARAVGSDTISISHCILNIGAAADRIVIVSDRSN
jgi:hypothetical protein